MNTYTTSSPMVSAWLNLIINGSKTIEDAPTEFKDELNAILHNITEVKSLEDIKQDKIVEMKKICDNLILNGVAIELTSGTYNFSFTLADQNNIKTWFDLAVITKSDVPYHANGQDFDIFSYEDIVKIYMTEQEYILDKTTYFNLLKSMIKEMKTIKEVEDVYFGYPLSTELEIKYQTIMLNGKNTMLELLKHYEITL